MRWVREADGALSRPRSEGLCAQFSKLRALRQSERDLGATGRSLWRTACGPLDPTRVGRKRARRTCRALYPGGIKDDKPQRPGKDRKQDHLSHPCTHVPRGAARVADIRLRKASIPRSRQLIALLRLRRGRARGGPVGSPVCLGKLVLELESDQGARADHDCSRAATSDRRAATMKSGFRDSASRLEPLLLDRVDVSPSFLPKQASTTPGCTPGLFFVGRGGICRTRLRVTPGASFR